MQALAQHAGGRQRVRQARRDPTGVATRNATAHACPVSTTTSAPRRRSSHAHARPTTPAPTTATRGPLIAAAQSVQFTNHFACPPTFSPRIGCCAISGGYRLAERSRPELGHRSDVMGSAAAADADVPDTEVARGGGEVGHLEPVAQERFERERECARPIGVLQRLEVRLAGVVR